MIQIDTDGKLDFGFVSCSIMKLQALKVRRVHDRMQTHPTNMLLVTTSTRVAFLCTTWHESVVRDVGAVVRDVTRHKGPMIGSTSINRDRAGRDSFGGAV